MLGHSIYLWENMESGTFIRPLRPTDKLIFAKQNHIISDTSEG